MIVEFTRIFCTGPYGTLVKEYDGSPEANARQLESDIYDGVDPLLQAFRGDPSYWVAATIKRETLDADSSPR